MFVHAVVAQHSAERPHQHRWFTDGSQAKHVSEFIQRRVNVAVLPDLSNTNVQQIVNVWGTKDILYQTGIGGKRDALCGLTGSSLINIEIIGATHFDYMLRGATDSNRPDAWNGTVSDFTTNLIRNSDTLEHLNSFLTGDPAHFFKNDTRGGVWEIKLDGWQDHR